jgi:hypothetical protein
MTETRKNKKKERKERRKKKGQGSFGTFALLERSADPSGTGERFRRGLEWKARLLFGRVVKRHCFQVD